MFIPSLLPFDNVNSHFQLIPAQQRDLVHIFNIHVRSPHTYMYTYMYKELGTSMYTYLGVSGDFVE